MASAKRGVKITNNYAEKYELDSEESLSTHNTNSSRNEYVTSGTPIQTVVTYILLVDLGEEYDISPHGNNTNDGLDEALWPPFC